ncbi:MAG: restriction endonuclease subunit S, partial [Chloroflexota bacterium]
WHFVRQGSFRREGIHHLRGGVGQQRVPPEYLANAKVPLPPLDEQSRIVARIKDCMERVDEIDSLRQASKAESSLILRAYYYDLYHELLKRHATFSLAEAGTSVGGGTPSKKQADYWTGDIPWVSPKEMKNRDTSKSSLCITKEAIENSSTKLIIAPSVMFVVRGMILAHTLPVAVNRVPVTMNQDMKAITPKMGLVVDFLAAMVRGAERDLLAQVEIAGHGTRRLKTEVWSAAPIPNLSEDEQAAVIAEVQNMEAVADELSNKIDFEEVSMLRESILRKAFNGEL